MSSLQGSGIQPVAISADTSEESRDLVGKAGFTFPILSDRNADVIHRYDLLAKGAGIDGRDISGTAEFLVDSSGTVRWRKMIETRVQDFLDAAKVLN